MAKWRLLIGNNRGLNIDEIGRYTKVKSIIDANDKDSVIEARRRIKKLQYYLVAEDEPRVINFRMFYKRYQRESIWKLGYNLMRYWLYYKWKS
jgi:hypothetical protein